MRLLRWRLPGWWRRPMPTPEEVTADPTDPEDRAWVDRIVEMGWPREIANAMHYFLRQDKTHVAAHLALEFMRQEEAAGRWPPPKPDGRAGRGL